MTTHDTLATTATAHCDEPLNTPPSANLAQPDDPIPPIHLHLVQRIRHLESYSLSSHTCLRHPKLTEQLRTLPDFPLFKRTYFVEPPDQVTNSLYYDQLVRNCYRFFMEDLIAVSEQVKRWFSTFGRKEETPIIDSFEVNPQGWMEYCVINGLRWDFASNQEQASQWTKYLDLHDLFSIDPQKQIRIEDAVPGSPLISLYIKDNSNTEGHKGQLFWYNLDTRGRGEMTDVLRYR
jgi:hypothetical protein